MSTRWAAVSFLLAVVAGMIGYGVANLTGAQDKHFKELIERHLASNPEIVVNALRQANIQRSQARRQSVASRIAPHREELVNDRAAPVGGNQKGDVTITEFFDYNCPFCKRVAPVVRKLLEEDRNIRYVYKEFPILRPSSEIGAKAALAAARQSLDLYERFHFALLEVTSALTEAKIFQVAQEVGLDVDRLRRDMQGADIQKAIKANRALAARLNITGTPTFVIGDQILPGAVPIETLRQTVSRARSAGRKK